MESPSLASAGPPRATPRCLALGLAAGRLLGGDSVLGGRRPSTRFDGPEARPPHRRSTARSLPQACARCLRLALAQNQPRTWGVALPSPWRGEMASASGRDHRGSHFAIRDQPAESSGNPTSWHGHGGREPSGQGGGEVRRVHAGDQPALARDKTAYFTTRTTKPASRSRPR
jgi:hypothetical protein